MCICVSVRCMVYVYVRFVFCGVCACEVCVYVLYEVCAHVYVWCVVYEGCVCVCVFVLCV